MNVLDIAKEKRAQLMGEIERLDNFLKTAVELEAIGSPKADKKTPAPVAKPKTTTPKRIIRSATHAARPTEGREIKLDLPKTAPLTASGETQPIPDGKDLAVPDYRFQQDDFDTFGEPDVSDMKIEAKPNADQITFQYPFNSALFQKILAEHRERHGIPAPVVGKDAPNGASVKQAEAV